MVSEFVRLNAKLHNFKIRYVRAATIELVNSYEVYYILQLNSFIRPQGAISTQLWLQLFFIHIVEKLQIYIRTNFINK